MTFYLPKYFYIYPEQTLTHPINGHFKLEYCDYEAEFDVNENKLKDDSRSDDSKNDDSDSIFKCETDNFSGLKDGYYYLNGV